MKPLTATLYLAAVLLWGSATAFGEECRGLLAINPQLASNAEQVDCGSLTTVMDSVVNSKKTGGRKLEEDKPYDPAAAQANLVKAQADPDVRKRLDKIRKDVP
ncbi:MAG: hypothetical protein JWP80_1258, partial [Pseudomonas sp.]|nr:hypothetical protein [Pseudomonas sp.]